MTDLASKAHTFSVMASNLTVPMKLRAANDIYKGILESKEFVRQMMKEDGQRKDPEVQNDLPLQLAIQKPVASIVEQDHSVDQHGYPNLDLLNKNLDKLEKLHQPSQQQSSLIIS